ncbi:MAG: MoxR family ATPase [Coleofasciculaceae cyanobacterium SM2_1_6]|nr:MoxR family ATPase [Coleofasciculaceae cyanobacterium SM2_1_6]
MGQNNNLESSPAKLGQSIGKALGQVVVGQDQAVQQLIIALLAGGHVILEGVPGTGKTLMVKVLAQLIRADFRRVQLTPDILPTDIIGTNIFDLEKREFTLRKGPVFTQILLADEINRTPPKTQSALLEAMEEQQVTLDGESLPLSELFWVIATQNPLEFEGTYPLPEAQLDRFLFKVIIDYPDRASEKKILQNRQGGFQAKRQDLGRINPVATVAAILQARQEVSKVQVDDQIMDYLLELVQRSRQHADLAIGASPRCTVAWMQTAKARAWLDDRAFVTPDDIKAVAIPLLHHRLILRPESMLDGLNITGIINSILQQVPVPR